MGVFDYILRVIFPPRCVFCGELLEPTKEDICFCEKCRSVWEQEKESPCPCCRQIPENCVCGLQYNKSRTLDSCRCLVNYESENVKKLIFGVKDSENKALFGFIARELEMLIFRKADISGDCVVAYPQRSVKAKKKHGHDQAELLAAAIGKDLGISVYNGIKNKNGKEQKNLPEKVRGENAYNSYFIPDKYKDELKGKNVILIDDIVTTGATAVTCAALCKLNGAASVSCFCIARTPKKIDPKGGSK